MTSSVETSSRSTSARQSFFELFGATSLAVTQPTFDRLGRNAVLFVRWSVTPLGLLALIVAVVLLPALLLWTVELVIASIVQRARRWTHAVLLGGVFAVLAIEIAKVTVSPGSGVLLVLSGGSGIIACVLVMRSTLLRSLLRALAAAPALFLAVLLASTPVLSMATGRNPDLFKGAVPHASRVAMLLLDEFPLTSILDGRGHVDAELFPNLALLAGQSNWYRNETTVSPFTETAVPAILSGRFPDSQHTPPFVSEYAQNLFTLLGSKYRLHVAEPVTQLCPPTSCRQERDAAGARQGTIGMLRDVYDIFRASASLDNAMPALLERIGTHDVAPVDHAQRFIDAMLPSHDKPTLDFLHLLLPHFPWLYTQSLQDTVGLPAHTNGLERGCCWSSEVIAKLARTRHLAQAQAADAIVGRFIARLRSIGEYDNTLIVVTADHGVAFRGGTAFRGVTESTWPDIMWTPLFVKLPHQINPVVDDRPALSIDVFPTIADTLGIRIPGRIDGRSLLASPRAPDATRPLLRWSSNAIVRPSRGEYLGFDGRQGFRRAMEAAAAPPGGDPNLRIFRSIKYGSLIGRPRAAITGALRPFAPSLTAHIDERVRLLAVKRAAARIPWSDLHGSFDGPRGKVIAVSINGTIAAITESYVAAGTHRGEFWASIAPQLFREGGNAIALDLVDGPENAPDLTPINIDAPAK